MKNKKMLVRIVIMFFLFCSSPYLKAQLIIKQTITEYPISFSQLPEDIEINSDEFYNFAFNLDETELKNMTQDNGDKIIGQKMIIYIDGENLAIESESEEDGKITMITNSNTGIINIIMWSQKKVMEMNNTLMNKSNFLKSENNSKRNFDFRSTGKTDKINGFNCEEYRGNVDEEFISIWVSNDNMEIIKEVSDVSKSFDKMFPSEDDGDYDEWELIQGKIPVQVKSLVIIDNPILTIQSITNIEKKKPSNEKFRIPGEKEGFKKVSMMEMMMQMELNDDE